MPFDFSKALRRLKSGRRITRTGWNGKAMYLFLVPSSKIVHDGTEFNYHAHIDMKTAQGYIIPWLASQADLLQEDWIEYDASNLPENDSSSRLKAEP